MTTRRRRAAVEASGAQINIVVGQLKRLTRTANLEFALRMGGLIIHHFYHGDTAAWRTRGRKSASFRRLTRHAEMPLSAGALYRCVALYELCERLNTVELAAPGRESSANRARPAARFSGARAHQRQPESLDG